VFIHWYREFAPQDLPSWDLCNGFQISAVHFGCGSATNPHVKVNVYAYPASMLYQSSIDVAQLGPAIGASGSDVAIPACPADDVAVPISAQVPAGSAFVVEVFETDYWNGDTNNQCHVNGQFRIGANTNTASETHRSYLYEPDPCQASSPARTAPAISSGTRAILISVDGTTN
jgi:hypothetical protein